MGILAPSADERAADVQITEDTLSVRLMDGRSISVPLEWYPRLAHASAKDRATWEIAGGLWYLLAGDRRGPEYGGIIERRASAEELMLNRRGRS